MTVSGPRFPSQQKNRSGDRYFKEQIRYGPLRCSVPPVQMKITPLFYRHDARRVIKAIVAIKATQTCSVSDGVKKCYKILFFYFFFFGIQLHHVFS